MSQHTETEQSSIRKAIAEAERVLPQTLQAIQAEATARIIEAVKAHNAMVSTLRRRLLVAVAMGEGEINDATPPAKAHPDGPSRRPAIDLMLEGLAKGPMRANEIDAMIMAEGWSKAMSEKAKVTLKKRGIAINEKRVWSLTTEGKHKFGGQPL